ncbi:MAG: NPCBM/NEW2 domain-containing protein [Planctomycetes bacterium]|nr:NPCBM/NEW2 domain-containing protein [Planctomycetota bacterium]
MVLIASTATAAPPEPIYLSEAPERLLLVRQGWGKLGLDAAAHQPGIAGLPLEIGGKKYPKGLGHHAGGSILILLDGEFSSFEAEVGIQKQASQEGSAVFRVLVDGEPRFESGVLRQADGARAVKVSVEGAQELLLVARDAGDGITCDMADWAEARLVPSLAARGEAAREAVDAARFARVVTWDPDRADGSRASRIEEFRAEDLFLETEILPDASGLYDVPGAAGGPGGIGLQWLGRRAFKELRIRFADEKSAPPAAGVKVEGWFGESAWQGGWKALAGSLSAAGDQWVFRIAPKTADGGLLQTQKCRWIIPPAALPLKVRGLSAFTRSRWEAAKLFIQVENPAAGARGGIEIYNGELLSPAEPSWNLARPLRLTVRRSRPSFFKSDATVLRLRLPSGAFGVAVEDILKSDGVYVAGHGLFAACDPPPVTLDDYKKKIAGQKTILERVRELPDQTLEQAMARTHHEAQREGPVLLSLAAGSAKFVVERTGAVQFQPAPSAGGDWFASAAELRPRLGSGKNLQLSRHLDGGWLPAPVISVEEEGMVYTQRAFAAPIDDGGERPARLNRNSACVVEFMVRNARANTASASLAIAFHASARQKHPARISPCPRGFLVSGPSGPFAFADASGAGPLKILAEGSQLVLSGELAAHESARCVIYLPGAGVKAEDLSSLPGPERLRAELEATWKAVLAPAMQAETPDPFLNDLIRSSQARCWIAARGEENGERIAPWAAAMSYGPLESEAHSVIRGMDLLGHEEFARRGLDFFIRRYNPSGFLTTGYTTFGTGWHLWTAGEHWRLHRDKAWLERSVPEFTRAGEWIARQLEKTKRLDPRGQPAPEYGLMPPGVLADWNAFAYHFCMNGYYFAALREAGAMLAEVGDARGAALSQKALELKENILRAYRWTQARSPVLPLESGAWIPAYPSQVHSPGKLADFFPGQDAGRSWCYDVELGAHQLIPAGVLDADGPDATRMLEHMEDVQFLAEGWFDYPAAENRKDWFNLGGFSKVQPYYTRNGEIYALQNDPKPFLRSYFNTLAAMLNPEVLTFWEHFSASGAWDKTHETGYFLQQTRFMLVMEHGEELWLAPLLPSDWLKNGRTVAVAGAPTRFGKVSYRIRSHLSEGRIDAEIDPPARSAPRAVVLRLRIPEGRHLRAVAVNGRSHEDFDAARESITIPSPRGKIALRAEVLAGE